ncbi:glycerol-3-phosphate 1-O-acyltransferase PlsY [Campylobacter sp. MIT 21-1685]|uniref:glycerol-3-phosphate 1-O-acyltransferase PlsY n=1 Tax=unclassified Campylobacter TaxID=2593542 RepID=UPI00224ABBCD|nr:MULTISPECIES: glycerol-3-phosphate 1-O-acyltransferase PlsY [unclassified Campylobacter]MCX2683486.1 glycerol-3-phosphate 1-O-acyltransferase PlsY [Campylobacter sp. MIT 21-1684]MCX2751767.1 glycerol-3-phosphate 1-O-acyltransferase PlsY [Campylobacter sp. MIT 21-1682]MCX2807968.1 glycerol-3-phosphate 1-O-acyltransferase PlsY [Campylobacter sp. MIT 21-1685]
MENLIIYAFVYLLGSIPFGLLLAKIFAKVDIQSQGSKSIGATNVLRVVKQHNESLAKKLALGTVVLDFAKAAVPLFILQTQDYNANLLWTVAVLLVLGHCFSIYLLFQGGKGIATGAGAMIVLLPLDLLSAIIVWFLIGKFFKISSLASLLALCTFLVSSFIFHFDLEPINTHAPLFIIAFFIVYKHWSNIKRLLLKKECKVI